jgi:hypothetical protein
MTTVAPRTTGSNLLPLTLGLLAGLAGTAAGTASATDAATAPFAKLIVNDLARENLKPALAEAARLLEAGQYEAFIETFVPPEELAEMKKEGADSSGIQEALQYLQKGAFELARAFRTAHDMEPTTLDLNKAAFDFDPPIQLADPDETLIPAIPMQKIGRYWYIGE